MRTNCAAGSRTATHCGAKLSGAISVSGLPARSKKIEESVRPVDLKRGKKSYEGSRCLIMPYIRQSWLVPAPVSLRLQDIGEREVAYGCTGGESVLVG